GGGAWRVWGRVRDRGGRCGRRPLGVSVRHAREQTQAAAGRTRWRCRRGHGHGRRSGVAPGRGTIAGPRLLDSAQVIWGIAAVAVVGGIVRAWRGAGGPWAGGGGRGRVAPRALARGGGGVRARPGRAGAL